LSHYNLLNTAYLDIFAHNIPEASKVIGCPIPIFHSFGLICGAIEPVCLKISLKISPNHK